VAKKTYRIYSCKRHPAWTLETAAPVIVAGLKPVCPHCREEFIVANIGLPDMRTEVREVAEQ
jgi:hypothetical protein